MIHIANPEEIDMNDLNPVSDVIDETPVSAEALIEEVSIDGMCGVY